MMCIETMKSVVDQFDRGDHTVIHELVQNWSHTKNTLKFLRSSSNFIFLFQDNNSWRIIRVVREDDRSLEMIKAELDFIQFLKKEQVPVVEPIKSLNGKEIESFQAEDGLYHAVVFDRVQGEQKEYDKLTDHELFLWGKGLAEIHIASKKYRSSVKYLRPTWKDEIQVALKTYSKDDTLISKKLLKLRVEIENLNSTKENFGLIHYDFELDNLIWNNGTYRIIDFDDCAYYPFIADIAFGIPDIIESTFDSKEHMLNKFIEGYSSIRKLSQNWRDELILFHKLMLFLKYARVLRSYRNPNPATDPEWTKKMRKRHMDWLANRKKELEEL